MHVLHNRFESDWSFQHSGSAKPFVHSFTRPSFLGQALRDYYIGNNLCWHYQNLAVCRIIKMCHWPNCTYKLACLVGVRSVVRWKGVVQLHPPQASIIAPPSPVKASHLTNKQDDSPWDSETSLCRSHQDFDPY